MNARDKQHIKAVHTNSLNAFQDIAPNITPRHQMILDVLDALEEGQVNQITDRQIAAACGFTDMNAVRPRITELINMGKIIDDLSVTCPVTDKKVRTLHSSRKREEVMREA